MSASFINKRNMKNKDKKKEKSKLDILDKNGKPISKKKLWIRAIIFFLVGLIAIGAFTLTFLYSGGYEVGYNQVKGATLKDVPLYEEGITFMYYLDDTILNMRTTMNYLKREYASVLSRLYILTDESHEYTGYTNVYSLNHNLGVEMQVSNELYNILYDAYEKTCEEKGYNMFAHALYNEWYSILILDEFLDFDPIDNEYQNNRIQKISEMVSDLSNFTLEFRDDGNKYVTFNCSDKYKKFVYDYELDETILDLNLLRDAYKLEYVAEYFKNIGYKQGYLTSTSGLNVSLGENFDAVFALYGRSDKTGVDVVRAECKLEKGSIVSVFKIMPYSTDELYYHEFTYDGKKVFRHPYISCDGSINQEIEASVVYGFESVADTCYQNIIIFGFKNTSEIDYYLDNNIDVINAYLVYSNSELHISKSAQGIITEPTEYVEAAIKR